MWPRNWTFHHILIHLNVSSHTWSQSLSRQLLPVRSGWAQTLPFGETRVSCAYRLNSSHSLSHSLEENETQSTCFHPIARPCFPSTWSTTDEAQLLPEPASHRILGPTPPFAPGLLPQFPPSLLFTAGRWVLLGTLTQQPPQASGKRNDLGSPTSGVPVHGFLFLPTGPVVTVGVQILDPPKLLKVKLCSQ